MPVTIDRNAKEVPVDKRLVKRHRRGMFKEVVLSHGQKTQVIYRKLESLDTELSDIYHEPSSIWVEEFTDLPQKLKVSGVSPRIFVQEDDEEVPINEDHGLILRFHGKCSGERGINSRGETISKSEVEEIQEMTGEEQPLWHLWEFRLAHVIITDGPERKERLLDTVEDQKSRSEAGLMDAIMKAFTSVAKQNENAPVHAQAPVGDQLAQALTALSPDDRQELFQRVELQNENTGSVSVEKDDSISIKEEMSNE